MLDFWYSIVDLLPFEWSEPGQMLFMKNALLAILFLTPTFGMLGTLVVNNRMAFFSDALGHGAFTGVVIGALAGFIEPVWSALIFSTVFSFGISVVKYKTKLSTDTVIGVFTSIAMATGIFLATIGGNNFSKLNTYLIGNLLSITPREVISLGVILIGVLLYWGLFYNKLLFASISKSLSSSRGISWFWLDAVFSLILSIVVTLSISWIGLLVLNSFLVLPAASARNISANQREYHLFSVLISVFSGTAGLIFSYYFETVTGATIVLIAGVIFFGTFLFKKRY